MDKSVNILEKLVEMTVDPNILPPIPNSRTKDTDAMMYTPRVSPKVSPRSPSMILLTLQDLGDDAFPSGFLFQGDLPECSIPPAACISTRRPVAYKNVDPSASSVDFTVLSPADIANTQFTASGTSSPSPGVSEAAYPPSSCGSEHTETHDATWALSMLNLPASLNLE